MKGLSHFVTGLAVTSFFPQAVQAAVDGSPLYFVLGGVAGLLPDTLDFRISRFLCRCEGEIAPDPKFRDPGMIARGLAEAVDAAAARGRPLRVRLDTVQLAANRWQEYTVRFDPEKKRVGARYGPVVDTGGRPVPWPPVPGTETGEAPFGSRLVLGYEAATTVRAFDGPVFQMTPVGRDPRRPEVRLDFIPWHRQWSHSVVVAVVLALAVGLLGGQWAGLVVFAAQLAHLLADQLGSMGSALLFPLNRKRVEGCHLMHSTDPFPNFATVWLACLLIFWNLSRAAGANAGPNLVQIVVFAGLLPLLLARLLLRTLTPRRS
ncbi:MAG: metal-dependent hydrolase [Kiritimatiellae bacterium]|nr:metal-dependent hydrolase [Kiritimatiellia bacterium]